MPRRATFEKQAPTVSYGAHADDLLVTLRAHPDAAPGEQVAVLVRADQAALEPAGTCAPLGMRAACSPAYVVRATVGVEQVMGTPFPAVSTESMVPISHL